MRARFVTPVGALILGCLLTGCGGSSGSAGAFDPAGQPQTSAPAAAPATSAPSAPPSTMTVQQINTQVLARYRAYQKAYEKAYERNDPSGLTAHVMDPLLGVIAKDIEKMTAKQEIWRFHNVLNPRIKGRAPNSSVVTVIDCVRTLAAYRFSTKTGKRLGAYRGGTRAYLAVLKYVDGTWKISNATEGQKC
jgi:hypothetical protein